MSPECLAKRIGALVEEKLAEDIVVLDLRGSSPLTDFFVIATAGSTIHAQALADEVTRRLRQEGERPHHVEGLETGTWVLLDYVDVVVHIFLTDVRQFYGLERLWGDAPHRDFRDDNNAVRG
ncbi:MAG: ribosome silencing factor [candidate division WOR-3 bacterium]|nr:MAG: ribosome silencing factor [candidate division WOR-3 bacterium]